MFQSSVKKLQIALLLILFTFHAVYCYSQSKPKYNVLFILVDDMNERCSMLGFPEVKTPNLDRLAAKGVVFNNAYTQFPLCNPSRTSILTGWRPDKTKVFDNVTSPRSKIGTSTKFLPEYFHDFGYRTERYGKILHSEFQSECKWDYAPYGTEIGGDKKHVYEDREIEELISGIPGGQWWISTQADSTKDAGRMCRAADSSLRVAKTQPFFIALGLQTPHSPFTPGINDWNSYGEAQVQELMPINSSGKLGNFTGNGSGNFELPNTPINDRADVPNVAFQGSGTQLILPDDQWKKSIHAYYSEVTELDSQLGRVIDAIDQLNLWDNTIIIFTSDHGQHLGEHEGMWNKNDLFNESLHVPMIVCAPGISPGQCDKLVELVDIYPTLIQLCGLTAPLGLEGLSILPLLVNKNIQWKSAAFSELKRGTNFMCRATINESYHYNKWGTYIPELYNRITDHFEYNNLGIDSFYLDTLAKMKTLLDSGWKKALPPSKDSVLFFRDADNDGYGDINQHVFAYTAPTGYVMNWADCDDSNPAAYKGAKEICDGIDNNCDGIIDEVLVNIYPKDSGFFCTGKTITLSTDSDTLAGYQWLRNRYPIVGANGPSYTTSETGNYNVEKNIGNCFGISNVSIIATHNNPVAKITPSANLNLCDTGAVLLTANSGEDFTYQWQKGTTIIKGAKERTYTPKSGGTFKVMVTNKYGCQKLSAGVLVTHPCKIGEEPFAKMNATIANINLKENEKLIVYPNPSRGIININFISQNSKNIDILLSSVDGTVLLKSRFFAHAGNNNVSLNLKNLSSGSYIISLTDNLTVNHTHIQVLSTSF